MEILSRRIEVYKSYITLVYCLVELLKDYDCEECPGIGIVLARFFGYFAPLLFISVCIDDIDHESFLFSFVAFQGIFVPLIWLYGCIDWCCIFECNNFFIYGQAHRIYDLASVLTPNLSGPPRGVFRYKKL